MEDRAGDRDGDGLSGPSEVAPGVWRIELPLPDSEVPSVALHALAVAGDRLVLVDAGYPSDEARAALEAGLSAIGSSVDDVAGVLLTHAHPDHHGLSAEIAARAGAWVAVHRLDAAALGLEGAAERRALDDWRCWLRRAGVPAERYDDLVALSAEMLALFRTPRPAVVFEQGWRAPALAGDLVAVATPGHSNGHVGFHDRGRRLLFGGDALLAGALPSIPSNPLTQHDPLRAHARSLDRLAALDVDLLLPGHGPPIADVDAEVALARGRMRRRLDRVAAVLGSRPATAWEAAERLPRSRPLTAFSLLAQRAMLGETVALLHALEREGRAERGPGTPPRWRARSGR